MICKRITGIPGDTIKADSGKEILLKKDQFWLEGDNKENSHDSRHYGPYPKYLFKGKVIKVLF